MACPACLVDGSGLLTFKDELVHVVGGMQAHLHVTLPMIAFSLVTAGHPTASGRKATVYKHGRQRRMETAFVAEKPSTIPQF